MIARMLGTINVTPQQIPLMSHHNRYH